MDNKRLTLYTGLTSNLIKRVYEHKNKIIPGFTSKYNLNKLVYYEIIDTIEQAIVREKQIKDLDRIDKLKLIKNLNPKFEDLYNKILDKPE